MRMHIGVKRVVVRLSKVGAALREQPEMDSLHKTTLWSSAYLGLCTKTAGKHATQVGSDEYVVRVYNTLERSVTKHSSLTRLRRRDEPRA